MKYLKTYIMVTESRRNDPAYDFISDCDLESFVEDYYEDNYHNKNMSLSDLCDYGYNFWNYLNDDDFIKDFINGEVDAYVDDFDYRFTSDYEKEEYMIPYLVNLDKEEANSEILRLYIENNLDEDSEDYEEEKTRIKSEADSDGYESLMKETDIGDLRDVVDNFGDKYDLCREMLEDMYERSSAEDIISEFVSKDNIMSYETITSFNLEQYIDVDAMNNDVEDQEITEKLDQIDIGSNYEFQKKLFDEKCDGKFGDEKCELIVNKLVSSCLLNKELGDSYEYQKLFFDIKIKEFGDGEVGEYEQKIAFRDVNELIQLGVTLDEEILKEFPDVKMYHEMDELGILEFER